MNWLFSSKLMSNSTSKHIFSFTSYHILKQDTDIIISVVYLDSAEFETILRHNNYEKLADYFVQIKKDFDAEFTNLNTFDAVCFHDSIENLVTISKFDKNNKNKIGKNSVICVRYDAL